MKIEIVWGPEKEERKRGGKKRMNEKKGMTKYRKEGECLKCRAAEWGGGNNRGGYRDFQTRSRGNIGEKENNN